jgi:hypothetical protein
MKIITCHTQGTDKADIIVIGPQTLLKFLRRPRIQTVVSVSPSGFDIAEERVTWKEYFTIIWGHLKG